MMKKMIIATVILLMLSSLALARTEKVTEKVSTEGANSVNLECSLGAGEFHISPAKISDAVVFDIEYNPKKTSYYVDSEEKRGVCFVELESENKSNSSFDTEDNIWDITLSTEHAYDISMEIGACDADFDFGGVPLNDFSFEMGAASGDIEFSEPNPIRLKEMSIEAGASSLNLFSIGNANFDEFQFSGGAGSFELDFRGEYNGESNIEIEIGLGSMDITLPKGVPVRVVTTGSNLLSSVDVHNRRLDEVDDDIYESDDFESAKTRITLEIEVGLGSVDIYWK